MTEGDLGPVGEWARDSRDPRVPAGDRDDVFDFGGHRRADTRLDDGVRVRRDRMVSLVEPTVRPDWSRRC